MSMRGALQGPFGRCSTRIPREYTEGHRQSYPEIVLNDRFTNLNSDFPENTIYTTKYTFWSFVPKLLFEQFRKATSFYFLIICILTSIPQVSPVSPATSWGGLAFILIVAAIREAYEDYLRLKADIKVNNAKFTTIEPGTGNHETTRSYQLAVGDLVYVKSEERIPVDLILLKSSRDDGTAYIETAQLDGETNLKLRRVACEQLNKQTVKEVASASGKVISDIPNTQLYNFKGSLVLDGEEDPFSLDENNLMLSSSVLRNTDYIIGLCVYAGPETKLGLNLKLPPSKFSSLDKKLNRYIIAIFLFKIALCIAMTVYSVIFQQNISQTGLVDEDHPAFAGFKTFVRYFSLMNYLIPLSLVVTLDVVRFVQATFIQWDEQMMKDKKGSAAKTSNLNDELALVNYVFSDKTGTLTENLMVFKKASLNGIIYNDDPPGSLKQLVKKPIDKTSKQFAKDYLYTLALAHSCQTDKDKETGELVYKSASPDEEALCEAARVNGFVFKGREGKYILTDILGKEEMFELLVEMEFTSDRRRMSVIVKTPKGKIMVYTKGADSVIADRLSSSSKTQERLKKTKGDLATFSTQGLRTLLLGKKELSADEYKAFWKEYNKAANMIDGREKALDKVCSDLEKDLELIGATAIEDRLQDGVPETIYNLRLAGVKIWVITGDKQETAINIGYSSNLLSSEMDLVVLNAKSAEETQKILDMNIKKINSTNERSLKPFAIVIDGGTLTFVLSQFRQEFMELGRRCVVSICNRVTPLQKAEIVGLVQETLGVVCLSIGDGGNDVSMIQQADIGVGIKGREGAQAARAADFAVPQFRCLQRLLLVHGRYSLLRNTKVIYGSFYKNVAVFMSIIWYSIFTGGSGFSIYGDWIMTFYNILFTSLPIFSLGVFEKDLREWIIEKNPVIYKASRTLKWKGLMMWFGFGVLHSIVIFFGCYAVYNDASEVIMPNGWSAGGNYFGVFVLAVGFHTVMIKLMLETNHWVAPTVFVFLLSFVAYYGWELLQSLAFTSSIPDQYYIFPTVFSTPIFWLTFILVTVTSLIPDLVIKYLFRQIAPKPYWILQERYTSKEKWIPHQTDEEKENQML
eukprot:TRINITY_DN3616_c0_g1_i1.p1 TRINITY_DN3616_c0_g1~~TRINITY_DN3616_c0_g1_i1.p1  ORF type:complete len:1085 (-),score=233.00 TRINITY_DN3616_c0_g1_i1:119-3373(-)